jgi:diguanylate cyclase (GGDEF)-like protein
VGRSGDLVARYGGEEFVFLAPVTDAAGALRMASRVVRAVHALALPHAQSPLGRVTVSIGVACLQPGPLDEPEALLRSADEALYQAKAHGRNRAELASVSGG